MVGEERGQPAPNSPLDRHLEWWERAQAEALPDPAFRIMVDESGDVSCMVVLYWDGPVMAKFSLTLYLRVGGERHEVARIDCSHREVHMHQFVRGQEEEVNREVLRPITQLEDVQVGYDMAVQRLVGEYEVAVGRWRSGR